MIHHAFYDPTTGLFVGRTFSTDMVDPAARERTVIANTLTDLAAAEGLFDHLSQRVDLDSLARARQARPELRANSEHVVDYQPEQPSVEHEWNPATKRWELNEAAATRNATRAAALARIAQLEGAQHRPLRELARDSNHAEARRRLDAIEAEINSLRLTL
jgi:hypothetical protein